MAKTKTVKIDLLGNKTTNELLNDLVYLYYLQLKYNITISNKYLLN